jgi:hypothetical protein
MRSPLLDEGAGFGAVCSTERGDASCPGASACNAPPDGRNKGRLGERRVASRASVNSHLGSIMSEEKKDTMGLILVAGGVAFIVGLWVVSLIMGGNVAPV